MSCQKIKRVVRKKNKPISTYIVPKSSQTYMYIPFKTYLNRHKYTYPLKHISFTLWSICPWTLQVIYLWPFIYDFFFLKKLYRPNKLKNKLKQKLHEVYCMIFLLTMPLLGQRRILHCLHSYPSRHGHISLASLSPTVTEI